MRADDDHSGSIEFTLDGIERSVPFRHGESVLEVLRERCGITSIKDGCRPQGQCGACLAIVNGHARVTCTLPADHLRGATIKTLASLSEQERARLVRSFSRCAGGGQCGFCVPAIALHTTALVEHHPEPTRKEIEKALDLHLCRCSGYTGFVKAIEAYAREKRGGEAVEPLNEGGVGAGVARLGAAEQVLGEKQFVADMVRPGLLHGALVLSEHARAKVTKIDYSKALQVPGVAAIITANDVPGERYQGLLERDWPVFIAQGEEVRCVGDVLAAVAAEDLATARAAAKLVEIEYEVLMPIVDPETALLPLAPRINPRHDNLLGRSTIRRGNAEEALVHSRHVTRGVFSTQRIEHLFLETECALAEMLPDGRLCVYSQGQGVYDDQRQIASVLGWPENRIVVRLVPNGGAFGGKEDLTVQGYAALLTWKTGRPVKLPLDREQSIRIHPKRHPMRLEFEMGCDAEGHFTAICARILGDSGAYASVGAKVLERAAGHVAGAYYIPHVDIDAWVAYTNNPPSGAMRGFGVPQVTFALESCIDDLAEMVGLDRWEIRYRNALRVGDKVTTGQVLDKSVGIVKCLEAVKPAWEEAKKNNRAAGIACGIKNSGIGNGVPERGRVLLRVENDGSISLFNGFTEMGQGLFTVLAQIASEVTKLPVNTFRPCADTEAPCASGQTTASRGALLSGQAARIAAEKLHAALDHGKTLKELAGLEFFGEHAITDTTPIDTDSEHPKTHTTYGFATQVVVLDESGHIERVVAAHDVGRALNPAFCVGQIEGAVQMGLGYALTEELVCQKGMPTTFWLRDLGVLRAKDMPSVDVILIEENEPEGPFGAKGIGEIGLVPTAAAVASAIRAGEGVALHELPMKDSAAAKAMSVGMHHTHHHAPPSERVFLHRGRP